jgi:formate-dependent nitrite reductase membrane component NrfD
MSPRRGEKLMVPEAEFTSYYGRPVIKAPVWEATDVPAYLFLGGLAGASSSLAACAQLAGYRELARVSKTGAGVAISLSMGFLVHDLGRPKRFLNMLRVFKPTSPMSMGSWLLAAYGPAAGAAAACAATGKFPRIGLAATAGAAVMGPGIATYTAALICDTSVPAWHDAHREMPYLFAASAATAAGGLGMLALPPDQARPAVQLAVLGAAAELTAKNFLERRLGSVAEPYHAGRPGALMKTAKVLTACGLGAAVLAGARRSRALSVVAGAALMTASAVTRVGVFQAGMASARDPKYTVGPQRERLTEREQAAAKTAEPIA